MTLLSVRDLAVHFPVREGLALRRSVVRAVDGVSFDLARGETLGLVGESGCGKTTTGRAVMRLLEPTSGRISLDGRDITHVTGGELAGLRQRMQIVFQDPYASLNPRMTVRQIIAEPLIAQGRWRSGGAARVTELLELVGLQPRHADSYPHQFSGGQRQRIGTARALALEPELLVLDEPVSALDVSIQAQLVNLFVDLRASLDMAMLFISHDLSVVRHISDRVAVMYLGQIVEHGPVREVMDAPAHPYTEALVSAVPGGPSGRERIVLTGDLPSAANPPTGCRFRTRCWKADDQCVVQPELLELQPGRFAACWHPDVRRLG
ncbi:ATP-binding cassette domain-containing protein [Kribbella sp. NBC_01245]|uniref:ABC transporter ATP-binding protein n=1 Tax=Kribbella sp. NBC_01245 TaxID=2903578 RepID=UPI002E2E0D2D|nr:oligopeptide/dipeptide ABC transporter ATP-binding protein [Kribbella sp. NBC_01245]